jgi:uncharacterized protein YjbI with pentapeptide repeats
MTDQGQSTSGLDMSGKDMRGADLSAANQFRANLREANLHEASVTINQLAQANLYENTIMLDGTKYKPPTEKIHPTR